MKMESHEGYEPVYLKNESIVGKQYKKGDVITFKVTEVMDDGVRAVCSHRQKSKPESDGRKEMAEHVTSRYSEAMNGEAGDSGEAGY